MQRALVEAAETQRFWRIGSEMPQGLDVRFLAISRSDMREPHATDQRFAEWLGCFTIRLPPLRERPEDLPSLIDETLRLIEARAGGSRKSLDASAFRALAEYHWPGNLRELTSVLERAALNCTDDVICIEHLPPLAAGRTPEPMSHFESEKAWILDGLKRNRFRRSRTAENLGISRKTLYNKMRLYGLSVGPPRSIRPPRSYRSSAHHRAATAFPKAVMPAANVLRPTRSQISAWFSFATSNSANHSTNVLLPSVIGLQ